MSYILEALRKAERERTLGQAPDIKNLYSISGVNSPKREWPWGWLVVAVLVLNAGGLAAYFWWQTPPTPRVLGNLPPEPMAATTTPAHVPPPPPVVNLIPPVTPPPTPAIAGPLEPPPARPNLPVVVIPPTPALPNASSFPSEPAATVTPEPVPVSIKPSNSHKSANVPALHTLPNQFRQAVPKLNLDVHVYSEYPERRFVMINSVQYRIGDTLREGPQVEDISEQGAVLSFLGQRFLLPVER